MKHFNYALIAFVALTAHLISCQSEQEEIMNDELNQNHIVISKFKAQPSKSNEAVEALTKLIEEVTKEPHFVSITLHIDPTDDTNILLYEEWRNIDYYFGEHMETTHLRSFMEESRNF